MHTNITVTDLNSRQWEYLTTEVPVDGRTFLDGLPRLCVEFARTFLDSPAQLHIEMDVAEFATRMIRLEGIKNEIPVSLPTLPTADQVRNLSAKDAVALARAMNECGDVLGDGTCRVHDRHISACKP